MPIPELNAKNKLISIYNLLRSADGQLPLDLEDFNFGTPEPYVGLRSPKNTRISLIPKDSASIYGRSLLYYNRIDLSTLEAFSVVKGTATTVLGLLSAINEELGIELEDFDVEEAALGNGPSFTLTASPTNLIFIGSATIGFIV
jgi:hypothetical protein